MKAMATIICISNYTRKLFFESISANIWQNSPQQGFFHSMPIIISYTHNPTHPSPILCFSIVIAYCFTKILGHVLQFVFPDNALPLEAKCMLKFRSWRSTVPKTKFYEQTLQALLFAAADFRGHARRYTTAEQLYQIHIGGSSFRNARFGVPLWLARVFAWEWFRLQGIDGFRFFSYRGAWWSQHAMVLWSAHLFACTSSTSTAEQWKLLWLEWEREWERERLHATDTPQKQKCLVSSSSRCKTSHVT